MTERSSSQKQTLSRQKIRKAILIVSFLLLPVTLFYVSPIVILMGAARGIATGSLLLFAASLSSRSGSPAPGAAGSARWGHGRRSARPS